MKVITSKIVANKLLGYLHHQLSLSELVDWAENAMMEGDFSDKNYETIREIVSRLGVADVKTFGLSWEDCEQFLKRLGYTIRVEVVAN